MRFALLIVSLIIFSLLVSHAMEDKFIESIPEKVFVPDQQLNEYIDSFSQGMIDHSGLRSLIQPLKVKELAFNLTINASNDLERARIIHEFVSSSIDYKARLDSIPAEQVLAEGWGDCSDMSVLTASLLEALGFKSYITNGQAHMYSVALINNSWIVVDPTIDFFIQDKWSSNLPESQAYLVNSTTTLLSCAYSTTSASA